MIRSIFLFISALFMLMNQSIVCAPSKCVTGNGKIISEIREIKDFSKVEVLGSMDVKIVSGKKYSVQVTDYENLVPLLLTEKHGNTLKISFDKCVRGSRAVVKITMPMLDEVTTLGSGDISINGEFKADEGMAISSLGSGNIVFNGLFDGGKALVITMKGSGDVSVNTVLSGSDVVYKSMGSGDGRLNLPGKINRISVNLAGAGDVTLKGDTARQAEITVLGSGDCHAQQITIDQVAVKLMGSGDCHVNVIGTLQAKVMGSGDVYYSGNPQNIEINKMGSGSVVKQ